jgi:SulP family sulfate permease
MAELIPDALTIALLCGIESLLAAVISEGMTGWRHQSNCELVAQGFANIFTSLFGGMPATGSVSRTAANVKSGALTPMAGMIHAIGVFLILFALGPLTGKVPLCSLAAVLFITAWNMSEIHHFLHLFTAPKKDIFVLIAVFLLTLLVDITAAVQIGMILAAFLFMKQMSDISDVVSIANYFDEGDEERDPDAIDKREVPEGVEVYEINGPFFFGVADRLKNLLNELERPPLVFILRMRKVPTIDASGMHALEEFFLECKRQRTILLLSGVRKHPLKDLKRYHLDELIGEDHIFLNISSALEFSKELLRVEAFKRAMR